MREGEVLLEDAPPASETDWHEEVSCPVEDVNDGLLAEDEHSALHRLLSQVKQEAPPGHRFVVVSSLAWATIQTANRRAEDHALETYVLGTDTPRVVSPVMERNAQRMRWALIAVVGLFVLAVVGLLILTAQQAGAS